MFIKNMVSLHCKMLVKSDLEKPNIVYKYVELGEAELEESISNETYKKLL